MVANVTYRIAGGPGSGVTIPQVGGASTFRYIGLFGSTGLMDSVTIGQAQDTTWLVNQQGNASGTLAGSGKMVNNKWVDASGVSIDGAARVALSGVTTSGEATIQITLTSGVAFNVQNARLFAYDGDNVNNDPSGIHVLSYEIIPASFSGAGDTQWALIDSDGFNYMVDRTAGVGYSAATQHDYFVGLSIRPKLTASSGITTFGLYFLFDIP